MTKRTKLQDFKRKPKPYNHLEVMHIKAYPELRKYKQGMTPNHHPPNNAS